MQNANEAVAQSGKAVRDACCMRLHVPQQDIARLWASITVYGTCMGFGAGLAALGVALPDLAAHLKVHTTDLNTLFTFRGLGIILGAILSAQFMETQLFCVSKHMICCIAVAVAGASFCAVVVFSMTQTIDATYYYAPLLIQGIGYGIIDSYSAVSISEMWGQRQQVWMQLKNLSAIAASVIAPVFLSIGGYRLMLLSVAALGCVSFIGVVGENLTVKKSIRKPSAVSEPPAADAGIVYHRISGSEPILESSVHTDESNATGGVTDDEDSDELDDEYDFDAGVQREKKFQSIIIRNSNSNVSFGGDAQMKPHIFPPLAGVTDNSSPVRGNPGELQSHRNYEKSASAKETSVDARQIDAAFGIERCHSDTDIEMFGGQLEFGSIARHKFLCGKPYRNPALMADEINMLSNCLQVLPTNRLESSGEWMHLTGEVLSATKTNREVKRKLPQQQQNSPPRTPNKIVPLASVHTPVQKEFQKLHRTLSFADQKIASKARKDDDKFGTKFGVTLVPVVVRYALSFFVFWQMSLLYATASWITAYINIIGNEYAQTAESAEYWANAAIISSSAFYCSQLLGSLLSVPLSTFLTASIMMRAQLLLLSLSTLLLIWPFPSTALLMTAACLLGAGLCSMFPLAMTIVNDYGFTMCSRCTMALVTGACVGKAVAPVAVGKLLATFGERAFPVFHLLAVTIMLLLYIYVNHFLIASMQHRDLCNEASPAGLKSEPSEDVVALVRGAQRRRFGLSANEARQMRGYATTQLSRHHQVQERVLESAAVEVPIIGDSSRTHLVFRSSSEPDAMNPKYGAVDEM